MGKRRFDPFELLLRRRDAGQLLDFFMRADERLTAAYPRASRLLPGATEPSAKQTRGSARRHYLHEALLTAARDVGLDAEIRWTEPATWNYPVVKIGAFSLTLGIVETKYRGASRTLRTRSKYMKLLCERNAPLDPQGKLFEGVDESEVLLADGSMGGLIVAQYRPHQPDVPAFLGFWVPSPDLSNAYYVRSFDEVITMLRDNLSLARKPRKKIVERKTVRIRKRPPADGQR